MGAAARDRVHVDALGEAQPAVLEEETGPGDDTALEQGGDLAQHEGVVEVGEQVGDENDEVEGRARGVLHREGLLLLLALEDLTRDVGHEAHAVGDELAVRGEVGHRVLQPDG